MFLSAIKLPTDQTRHASKFDVVGSSVQPDYINHLGMLSNATEIRRGATVSVFEMGPPLAVGQLNPVTKTPNLGEVAAHVIGWLDDLTSDEMRELEG